MAIVYTYLGDAWLSSTSVVVDQTWAASKWQATTEISRALPAVVLFQRANQHYPYRHDGFVDRRVFLNSVRAKAPRSEPLLVDMASPARHEATSCAANHVYP